MIVESRGAQHCGGTSAALPDTRMHLLTGIGEASRLAPPTPPDMRVRIRRFGRLSDRRHHWYALVIPRKHVISIYELSMDEQSAVWGLVAEVAADRPETGRLQYRRERWFRCRAND